MKRCAWAASDILIAYHDEEWGVPLNDDQRLFEFLILKGAQAGLSWVRTPPLPRHSDGGSVHSGGLMESD